MTPDHLLNATGVLFQLLYKEYLSGTFGKKRLWNWICYRNFVWVHSTFYLAPMITSLNLTCLKTHLHSHTGVIQRCTLLQQLLNKTELLHVTRKRHGWSGRWWEGGVSLMIPFDLGQSDFSITMSGKMNSKENPREAPSWSSMNPGFTDS